MMDFYGISEWEDTITIKNLGDADEESNFTLTGYGESGKVTFSPNK